MTFVYEEEFALGQNTYKILKVQSRPYPEIILTLYRQVSVGEKNDLSWIPVFVIEEGDIVWSTIAENQADEQGNIHLGLCFDYLKSYARYFDKHYPKPLTFRTPKKAEKFSDKTCIFPLRLTKKGGVYPRHPDTLR